LKLSERRKQCRPTDLFFVMEAEREIRPPGTLELSMRPDLLLKRASKT
jgi:hypothetical protein